MANDRNAKTEEAVGGEKALQVKVLWKDSPIEVKYFLKPGAVTLGSTPRCDFYLIPDGLPVDEFPIARTIGGDLVITFTGSMGGSIAGDGETKQLDELVKDKKAGRDPSLMDSYQYTLAEGATANVKIGSFDLEMKLVPKPDKLSTGAMKRVDYTYLNALLVALFASGTLLVSLFLFPFDIRTATEDVTKNPSKFVSFIMTPAKKVEEVKQITLKDTDIKTTGKANDTKVAKVDVFKQAVKKARPDDKELVNKTGLLKIFGKGSGIFSGSSQIFGGKGLGGELQNALSGLYGMNVGSAGAGALGLKGGGPGGGGGLGSIGIGSVGTRGRGSGDGSYGSGAGSIGGKRDVDIGITGGSPMVLGSLDKELIRRVVQSHRNEIRYCYERALTANPGLWGKISINFIIGAKGDVQSSKVKESTMGNADVENCIAQKVKTWRFPEPKGGGIVVVTYPFVLKQTD
ncbi:MAG: AgmX/PglI C-terminal domain-containing protein [Myxococcota bacterium]